VTRHKRRPGIGTTVPWRLDGDSTGTPAGALQSVAGCSVSLPGTKTTTGEGSATSSTRWRTPRTTTTPPGQGAATVSRPRHRRIVILHDPAVGSRSFGSASTGES
jgi:hypothetical protein